MPLLYLISCRIFEDELVHIFEEENDDTNLIIIDNGNTEGMEKKLMEVSVEYEMIPFPDISSRKYEDDKFNVILHVLEFALDADPQLLKEKVYSAIDENGRLFDGILVFYGLCGNVLGSLEKDFSHLGIPVRILKDAHGNIVDDCICAAMESKNTYVEAVMGDKRGAGTYFLTPMQAANWREMLVLAKLAPDPDDTDMMKMVFEYSGYKNVAKVDTGLCYEKEFDSIVDEFASIFELEKLLFKGSTQVTDMSYHSIKKDIMSGHSERTITGD